MYKTYNSPSALYTVVMIPVAEPKPKPKPKFVPTLETTVLRACQLAWWSVSGYGDSDDRQTYNSINGRYERKGWVGLTVTNMSDREYREIKAWQRSKGKALAYVSRREVEYSFESNVQKLIGEYEDYSLLLWFADDNLRNEFVRFLEQFPVRDAIFWLKNPKAVLPLVKGFDYKLLVGERATTIALGSDVSEIDKTLIAIAGA